MELIESGVAATGARKQTGTPISLCHDALCSCTVAHGIGTAQELRVNVRETVDRRLIVQQRSPRPNRVAR